MAEASTTTHSDPARPAFGYDGGDPFYRALNAQKHAEWLVEYRAIDLAEDAVLGLTPSDTDITRYVKAKAARVYAEAVYEVEAAKVRAA